jgi:hypothetical protein
MISKTILHNGPKKSVITDQLLHNNQNNPISKFVHRLIKSLLSRLNFDNTTKKYV